MGTEQNPCISLVDVISAFTTPTPLKTAASVDGERVWIILRDCCWLLSANVATHLLHPTHWLSKSTFLSRQSGEHSAYVCVIWLEPADCERPAKFMLVSPYKPMLLTVARLMSIFQCSLLLFSSLSMASSSTSCAEPLTLLISLAFHFMFIYVSVKYHKASTLRFQFLTV